MQFLLTAVKLAAYITCVHLSTKMGQIFCQRVRDRASSQHVSPFLQGFLGVLVAAAPLAPALVVTIAFALAFERDPVATLGLHYNSSSPISVAVGTLVGCVCVGLVVMSGCLLGFIKIRRPRISPEEKAIYPSFLMGLTDFFAGAIYEEVITRGYIFTVLYQTWGSAAAIIGSAILFLMAHFSNGAVIRPLFTLNIFIFGIVAALCRWHTGALWLSIGLHLGWNVMECPIFGLPYSGKAYRHGMMNSDVSGPEWLTGGAYSPDAGVLGTLGLLLAILGLQILTRLA